MCPSCGEGIEQNGGTGAGEGMTRGRKMLGEVVSAVGGTRLPINMKMALFDSVLDPIKTHVHGFGFYLLARLVGNGISN